MNEENHGAVFEAMSVARFGAEDEARAKWLAEQIAHEDETPARRVFWCPKGHRIDGVKNRKGRVERYCKTCTNRWRNESRARARKAKEGANG